MLKAPYAVKVRGLLGKTTLYVAMPESGQVEDVSELRLVKDVDNEYVCCLPYLRDAWALAGDWQSRLDARGKLTHVSVFNLESGEDIPNPESVVN